MILSNGTNLRSILSGWTVPNKEFADVPCVYWRHICCLRPIALNDSLLFLASLFLLASLRLLMSLPLVASIVASIAVIAGVSSVPDVLSFCGPPPPPPMPLPAFLTILVNQLLLESLLKLVSLLIMEPLLILASSS